MVVVVVGHLHLCHIPYLKVAMGSSDSLAALYDSLTAQPPNPGAAAFAAVRQFWRSVLAACTSLPNSLRNLYRNESLNRGQVVFLITCVIMAGCGLLSSLLRRNKRSPEASQYKRLSARKRSRNSSSNTPTSSSEDDYEDEEYDGNGSLHRGTDPKYPPKDWSHAPQAQTSDGA